MPVWEPASGASDFPCKALVKELISNPHYKELTPAANSVGSMLGANSAVVKAGLTPLYSPQDQKTGSTLRSLAFNTLSLTYAVYNIFVMLPKTPVADRPKNARALLTALESKETFTIPTSLKAAVMALIQPPLAGVA